MTFGNAARSPAASTGQLERASPPPATCLTQMLNPQPCRSRGHVKQAHLEPLRELEEGLAKGWLAIASWEGEELAKHVHFPRGRAKTLGQQSRAGLPVEAFAAFGARLVALSLRSNADGGAVGTASGRMSTKPSARLPAIAEGGQA